MGNRQDALGNADIRVFDLDEIERPIMLGVLQNGLRAFGVSVRRLNFQDRGLSLDGRDEIEFKSGILGIVE